MLPCIPDRHGDDILCPKTILTSYKEFNVSKCKVMHFGKGNIRFRYIMDKQALEEVDCEKDLGVNVCQDLKVSVHCREAYSKANRMLG